jgi:hypothetical protein
LYDLILLRESGFSNDDYDNMTEREYNNIVGILRDNKQIEKLELRMMLLQTLKLSLVSVMCKGGNSGFKTMYNDTEKQLKKLYGILETESRFIFKGGRRKLTKF